MGLGFLLGVIQMFWNQIVAMAAQLYRDTKTH